MKEKEVLPALLPKAGGGATELLVAPPKLNVDWAAAGAAAVEFDPAEKLKLLALTRLPAEAVEFRMLLLLVAVVFAVPIPPKAKGLLGAGAAVDAEAAAALNENGAGVGEVTLD